MTVAGLDVSDYQGTIRWDYVQRAHYFFGIAKATQGVDNVQSTFTKNMNAMRYNGIVAGAYHFFDWEADPAQQAEHFLATYTPRNGDLPPALDCEGDTGLVALDAIGRMAIWTSAVEKKLGGAKCLLYMSYSFATDALGGSDAFAGHPLWVAAYSDAANPPVPPAWKNATIWQYTDRARIFGIVGNVDADRFIGSRDDLAAFTLKGLPR